MIKIRTTNAADAFDWLNKHRKQGYEIIEIRHRYEWWVWRWVYVYEITMRQPLPKLEFVWGPTDERPNPPDPGE